MAETALEDLYDIMRDPASRLRNRLNAAVAASRIVKVVMPSEPLPECVQFLDEIIGTEHGGSRFKVEYRREAATAKGYYEKRVNAAVLKLGIPEVAEPLVLHRGELGILQHVTDVHNPPLARDPAGDAARSGSKRGGSDQVLVLLPEAYWRDRPVEAVRMQEADRAPVGIADANSRLD